MGGLEPDDTGYGVRVFIRLFSLVFLLYRMYRRLPKSQKRQLHEAVQRYAPRVASAARNARKSR